MGQGEDPVSRRNEGGVTLTSSIFSVPSIGVTNSLKALRTQNHLKDSNINFFGNEEWPGNFP